MIINCICVCFWICSANCWNSIILWNAHNKHVIYIHINTHNAYQLILNPNNDMNICTSWKTNFSNHFDSVRMVVSIARFYCIGRFKHWFAMALSSVICSILGTSTRLAVHVHRGKRRWFSGIWGQKSGTILRGAYNLYRSNTCIQNIYLVTILIRSRIFSIYKKGTKSSLISFNYLF